MSLTRLEDWRFRYDAAIDEIKTRPFDWKAHECVTGLAGRIVLEITGVDLISEHAGRYDDAASAVRFMRGLGFDNLGDLVASMLPEIHPSKAEIGDIAALKVDSPFRYALGVVNGERIYFLGEAGFGTMDLLDAQRAFKVG